MRTATELSPHLHEARTETAETIAQDVIQLGDELLLQANPYEHGVEHASIHRSRLLRGNNVYNLDLTHQPSGAFKLAAAHAAVYFATREAWTAGEVIEEGHVASAGNAARAFTLAGRAYDLRMVAHTPASASSYKLDKLEEDGAEVHAVYRDIAHALSGAKAAGNQPGKYEFHPFDRKENMAGLYATIGQETVRFIEALQMSETAPIHVVAPLGGGSLASTLAIALREADLSSVKLFTAEVEETLEGTTYSKEALPFCDGTATKTGTVTGTILEDTRFREGAIKVRTDQVASAMKLVSGEPAGALSRAGVLKLASQEQDPEIIYIDFLTGNNMCDATRAKAAELAMRGCGVAPL